MPESIQNKEQLILRTCLLCGCDNRSCPPGSYSQDSWDIKTCPQCGFTYLENVPVYPLLENHYAWERTSQEELERRRKSRPLERRISEVAKQFRRRVLKRDKLGKWLRRYIRPGNVLDVGCGTGHVLEMLPESYLPFGIEISKDLAESSQKRVKKRGGKIVHANAIEGVKTFSKDFFSGALLSAFLEHESNPVSLLRELYPVLKKNAGVIIKVPNYSSWNRRVLRNHWCGFRYPDHVNYFTPQTLNRLVIDCGYRIGRFNFWDRFPLSDNMWMLLLK